MDDEKETRYLAYKQMGLPKIYWDVRPLDFIGKKKALKRAWEDVWEAAESPKSFGAILETGLTKIAPAFAAAFLKWGSAKYGKIGRWVYFPDLVAMAYSVKFNADKWNEYVDGIINSGTIVVVDMDVKKELFEADRLVFNKIYDFFRLAFWGNVHRCLIVTPNDVDTFESILGEDLVKVLTSNLGCWRKM